MALEMVTGKGRCQASDEVFQCRYAFDPSSTGTASSIEGTLALCSGGRPAVEQTVADPSVGKDCHPSAFRIYGFSERFTKTRRFAARPFPSLSPWWCTMLKRLHKRRPRLFRPGCPQGAVSIRSSACRCALLGTCHFLAPSGGRLYLHESANLGLDSVSTSNNVASWDCGLESRRGYFCVIMKQHGLNSTIHFVSLHAVKSVRHAGLDNE